MEFVGDVIDDAVELAVRDEHRHVVRAQSGPAPADQHDRAHDEHERHAKTERDRDG